MLGTQAQLDAAAQLHRIRGGEGHPLGVLEKTPRCAGSNGVPVLLVHGATLGAALFDIPLPGYSVMSELAVQGSPVYAVDIRGYGSSLPQAVMEEPPERNAPFARLDDAVGDVMSAAEFICARTGSLALDVIGFSWGSVVAARFSTQHPGRVRRLVLYAPLFGEKNELWRTRIGDPDDRSRIAPDIGAYRLIARDDIRKRWDADIGSADPDRLRDVGMPDAIFDAFALLDPLANNRSPAAFRSPTGALADLVHIFNGTPLYDPKLISMPTLLIRGADDTTSTDTDARNLLSAISASYKDYQVIAPGSHFLCVEKNRRELHERIRSFLGSTDL